MNAGATTLTQQAYDMLRWDIVSGTLEAGSPLRLDNLKQRYGFGYSPLREALNRLHSERLVTTIALRGFTVAPMSLSDMWDAIDTRIHIESQALRRAIQFGDDEWEAEIVSNFHALSVRVKKIAATELPSIEELKSLEDRHHRFHSSLIRACRSNWLLDFAEKLYMECERYRFPVLAGSPNNPSRDPGKEHQEIMEATLARDPDRAISLLAAHYRRTGDVLAAGLEPASAG